MDMLTVILAASTMERLQEWASKSVNYSWAVIGLGMVIFFHELGHFAVAKWCNVNVERFSIGFGPILFSWKWGETEYALSLIPFGGYVKMLGQDDADPTQLTNEEIAQDPRSYVAKNVWQRMAIISAGVTMNIITAVFFVGGAFMLGLKTNPSIVGEVRPGMPAWKAGLQPDDVIDKINGRTIQTFEDVRLNVALSSPPLKIEGYHPDGERFTLEVEPEKKGSHPQIGVQFPADLRVWMVPHEAAHQTEPGKTAEKSESGFERGDLIKAINGTEVKTYWQLRQRLASLNEEPLKVDIERTISETPTSPKSTTNQTIVIKDNCFRSLGLWMDSGPIAAIQKGSPADKAGLKEGDKLFAINGKKIGTEINPLKLPNLFAGLHGQDVEVTIGRQPKGGSQIEDKLMIRPEDLAGWVDQPLLEGEPISIPSIGVAFHTIPVVKAVEPDSPAAEAGISLKPGSVTKLKRIELVQRPNTPSDGGKETIVIDLDDPTKEAKSNNWGYAFWRMQEYPNRTVKLTLIEEQKERKIELTPQLDPSWPLPVIMGLTMYPMEIELKAKTAADAWTKSTNYTRNSAMNIYLTLQSLFTRRVSVKELRGPLGIAEAALQVAQHGAAPLLLFLGFLSVNLAVLNFLPIPILDGGHMVFLIWEAVTRRRPNDRVIIGAQYAGMLFLLSLMVFVVVLDFGRWFGGAGK